MPTLLILDDDPVVRTFLADNLTADGYELLIAQTVAEALEQLERGRPDLAVIDVGLPDGSGLELLRAVRGADGVASRVDPTMPILVLSGCDGELDRMRGFEKGADDYVTKPFAYGELRGVVSRSISRFWC
jgi:DNA-binding response OmpR family regulator